MFLKLGMPLPMEKEIPDHPAFPLYAPSFTLDVPAGNMQDQNSDVYLQEVEGCFRDALDKMKERLTSLEQNET